MERHEHEPQATPAASCDAEVERLRAALAEAEGRAMEAEGRVDEEHRRAEGYLALLKRERADFQNYRRRVEQERAEQVEQAGANLVRALLPILDGLERALHSVPVELGSSTWVKGIDLIERALREALERAGLTRIAVEGQPFDPRLHEALVEEDAPGHAGGEVVHELQPGYRLRERVLRPAQVSVARGTSSSAAGTPDPPP